MPRKNFRYSGKYVVTQKNKSAGGKSTQELFTVSFPTNSLTRQVGCDSIFYMDNTAQLSRTNKNDLFKGEDRFENS